MSKKYLLILPLFLFFLFSVLSRYQIYAQTSCPVSPTSGNSITSTLTVSQTGTYIVWSRLNPPDISNNSYYLQIDGSCAIAIGDSSSTLPNTWTWIDYQDGVPSSRVSVSLTAGDHTIKLIQRESGVRIDRLLFTQDSTCVPQGFGEECVGTTITPQTPTATVIPTAIQTPSSTPIPTAIPTPIAQTTTFGYTSIGASVDSNDSGNVVCSKFVNPNSGILISMSVYIKSINSSPNNQYQVGVYTDNGANPSSPSTVVATTSSGTLVANSWNTRPLTANVSASTYWLCYETNGPVSSANNTSYDTGSTGQTVFKSAALGTWPASFGTPSFRYNEKHSMYATVTTMGTTTPTSTPIPTVVPNMTVSGISMTSTKSGKNRTVNTVITVKNELTSVAISAAAVSLNLKLPSGTVSSFNGTTNSNGQITFSNTSKQTGVYKATVNSVTKTGYTYHPTNTTKSLTVN